MGFAYFTIRPPLPLFSSLSRALLSLSVQCPRESFTAVLLRLGRGEGTILDSYGAQSKLPMNINAGAKSSQLNVTLTFPFEFREEANDLSFSSLTKQFLVLHAPLKYFFTS